LYRRLTVFIKAIRYSDVRPGDMVSENADLGWFEISRCEVVEGGWIRLHICGGDVLQEHPGTLIGLMHRPPLNLVSQVLDDIKMLARTTESVAQLGQAEL